VNRISDEQIAALQWYQDPGAAATVSVGSSPRAVAFDGTNIWVTSLGSGTVSKIDPATKTVTATVGVGTNPQGVAFDGTSIWVTNVGSGNVSKIDPATNTVTATVGVGTSPRAVAFDGTSIWVTNSGSGNVSRINPATNTVTATVGVGTSPFLRPVVATVVGLLVMVVMTEASVAQRWLHTTPLTDGQWLSCLALASGWAAIVELEKAGDDAGRLTTQGDHRNRFGPPVTATARAESSCCEEPATGTNDPRTPPERQRTLWVEVRHHVHIDRRRLHVLPLLGMTA
jgi:YVTN family beta-propeller protein